MASKRQKQSGYLLPEDIAGDGQICVRFDIPNAPEYIQAVQGHVMELAKWWSWERSFSEGDMRATQVAAIFRGMLLETLRFGDCETMTFELRQSLDDPCLLEQSLDGGETWAPAFNYALCGLSNDDYQQAQVLNETENARRLEVYDGTPTSIHPDTPTTTFNGGSGGDLALCAAVAAYVEKQVRDTQWRYRVAGGLVGAGVGLLAATGVLGAIVGGVVAFIAAVAIADVENAAGSRTDIDAVICQLRDEMEGTAVTEADFQVAINALVGENHNQDTIIYILQGNAGATVNYLLFLEMLGQAQSAALAGVVSCPCDDAWCYEWEFDTEGIGSWVTAGLGYTMNYVAGVGIQHRDCVDTVSNPDIGYRGLNLQHAFDERTVTKIAITYDVTKGSFDYVNPGFLLRANGSVTLISVQNNAESNGTKTRTWTGSLAMSLVQLFVRVSRDQTAPYSYSGAATVTKIRMEGLGLNPFGEDNC